MTLTDEQVEALLRGAVDDITRIKQSTRYFNVFGTLDIPSGQTYKIAGSQVNLTAAQLTDLTDAGATTLHKHDHAAQDNLNSTNYTHLTAANHTDLTDGGATTLHTHAAASYTFPVMNNPQMTTPGASSGTSVTKSYAVANNANRVLHVFALVTRNAPGDPGSLSGTWDGSAMTVETQALFNTSYRYGWLTFTNPAVKTANIVISWTNASTVALICVTSYNTHQTTELGTITTETTPDSFARTVPGDLTIDFSVVTTDIAQTPGPDQTEVGDVMVNGSGTYGSIAVSTHPAYDYVDWMYYSGATTMKHIVAAIKAV